MVLCLVILLAFIFLTTDSPLAPTSHCGESRETVLRTQLDELPQGFPETKSTLHNESEWKGWIDPRLGGGRMIDFTTKRGRGEPLNVIISGFSDPRLLTEAGFRDYSTSIGFSSECFGMHYGNLHEADLGDGHGRQTEQYLARQWYMSPVFGSCWESLVGGNHFRAWKQDGTEHGTNAWFLGVSKELWMFRNHLIAPNGYDLGRDWLVERAISGTKWNGVEYTAEVEWVEGLLNPGKDLINHCIEQDGFVAVLTVRIAA